MKKIITFLSLMLCLFATAQEVTDTMYIYQNDKIIERIPVFKIDSVIFVPAKTPADADMAVAASEPLRKSLRVIQSPLFST